MAGPPPGLWPGSPAGGAAAIATATIISVTAAALNTILPLHVFHILLNICIPFHF
jgi:hypothetical protein